MSNNVNALKVSSSESGNDLGADGGGGYRTVFAHAFQDFADRTVRLFGGDAEHAELAAVRVGDVLRLGNHRTNYRGLLDYRLKTLLDGQSGNHIVASAVIAHIREIVKQERVSYGGWRQRDDFLALLLFEAEDQVGFVGHLSGQSSGTETARLNADALHKAAARRIDRMHRQTTRAGARYLHGGAVQIVGHQKLAHRGTANVARADEHDVHTKPLENFFNQRFSATQSLAVLCSALSQPAILS